MDKQKCIIAEWCENLNIKTNKDKKKNTKRIMNTVSSSISERSI